MHPFLSEIIEQLSPGTHWSDDQILREEIFSIERLEEHARSLAAAQPIGAIPGFGRSLATRLRSNEKALLAAYRSIAKAVDEGRGITPAAEWVLDNYHVVEEQIREIREDLPPQFYRQLPEARRRAVRRFPARVRHRLGIRRAHRQPLRTGDAATLRVRLSKCRAAHHRRVVGGGHHPAHRAGGEPAPGGAAHRHEPRARQEADAVADRLLGVNGQRVDPDALRAWRNKSSVLTPAFAVQLVHRLRDQDPKITPALLWLEKVLTEHETSSEQLLQEEHQRQGASNVTVRNIITSMRLMSDVDWAEFFESVSLVDEALNTSADFAAMDFATRNLYRNAIEELGRGSRALGARHRATRARHRGRQRRLRANATRAFT